MKKVMLVLAILIGLNLNVYADLGDPTIQVVCRVTLVGGQTYEGFIKLGQGSYEGTWMNGFYFGEDQGYSSRFFALDTIKLARTAEGRYQMFDAAGNVASYGATTRPPKLYFLEHTGHTDRPQDKVVAQGRRQYLVRTNQGEIRYKMLDTLTIFTELPSFLHLPGSSDEDFAKAKKINIPLSRIASLELLRTPPRKLLDHLAKKRKTEGCTAEVGEDCMEPVWYHEILKAADNETINTITNRMRSLQ